MITPIHCFSTLITLLIVSYLGFVSSKNVKSSKDFAVGNRQLSKEKVAGSLIATIVGGASTIGTSELAFQQGVNAMWFTLGSSIACIFLGALLAGPLRRAEVDTIPQFLSRSYGVYAGFAASIFTSIAIFIHITGQVLSSTAILTSMFHVTVNIAVVITMVLIISYIFFGGFLGTSIIGIAKTLLLYLTLAISGVITYKCFHGIQGFTVAFPREPWFDLFSGGISEGLAMGFSLVVGVASTQTYLQALFAGKDERESRNGAFLSALLIPPIGLISTFIGMYMKTSNPNLTPSQALPTFILTYLNPWIGGIAIAALIVSVIGTGAGLTLGISTMINRDIYLRFINPKADDKKQLMVLRLSVFALCAVAMLMVFTNLNTLILKWSFLSMALRGTTIFFPLIAAIYYKDKINKMAGLVSIIAAPVAAIIWELFGVKTIDPLYIGLATSIIFLLLLSIIPQEAAVKKGEVR
ncbi:sodium:solute symporter family protein [Clostridium thailandense]|uniref:sodium:solute symporter family protein n=1 Tax=Clostridium thailandense TaxID=2794346 RepID=UPI00398A4A2F